MSALLSRLRAKRGDGGFTLVELLVVVVIIGILIAIAIPVYLNYTKSAKDKSAQSDLRNAISVLETCNSDNNAYPASVDATGAMTTCAGQSIKLSNQTVLSYFAPTTPTSYVLVAYNSGGKQTDYCYNSTNGGSVKTLASVGALAAAAATC